MIRRNLSFVVAMALAAPAWAEAPDADAVDAGGGGGPAITVTATRTPTPVEDVPVTVSVIDEEEMADALVSDIKDLVRFEPGVSVRQSPARFGAALGSTGRDRASGFNIRGLEGNRVLMLVDGVRVPDGFSFGAQAAGRGDYVDLGLVKSVEILRGPASALYGSDGLAGAVSFVTSDPADFLADGKAYGGRLRAQYDSADEEWTGTSIIAGRSGDWSAMLAYTRRDGKELDNQGSNDVDGAARTTPNPQDTEGNALLGKIVWAPDDVNRVRLTYDHSDSRVQTDVLSGRTATVLNLWADDRTERDRIALDWTHQGTGAIDFAHVTVHWQDGEDRQFTFEDRQPAVDRTRLNTFENRVIGAAAELRSDFATGAVQHRLAYGADVSVTRQKGLRSGTVPTPPDVFPTRAFPVTDFTLAGAFVSDEIAFADGAFTIFPALRFDYYDLSPDDDPLLPGFAAAKQDGSRLSPKIGAVWKAVEGVSLFANYAQGFKAPAPSQVNQFFENPTSPFFAYRTIPNPDLRPETSKTVEGGIRFAGEGVSAGITAFSGRYRNFISQQQVGGTGTVADPIIFQFVNLSRVKIEGVEGRFEAQMPAGFTGQLAISYAKGDVNDGTSVRPLDSIDPLKLVAGIGWRDPGDRFGAQLIATHSARKEAGRTTGICTPSCYRPDAFTILDLTAFARVADFATLRAGVFNVLDEKYAWWSDVRGLAATATNLASVDAYTQPGRNVSVSLTLSF